MRFRVISWIAPLAERKSTKPNSDNIVSRRTLGTGTFRFRVISVPRLLIGGENETTGLWINPGRIELYGDHGAAEG